jgi:ADP-ribose pyrophosphatase YjhB (NUDIX family)
MYTRLYGFQYHHAEGEVATMMLWLPSDVECKVPPFATHHVGVAGAVIVPGAGNSSAADSKILLVREKSKQAAGWKLPGGYANLGEDFSKAAIREIYEETGIKARFENVLTVRHSNNIQFGRDDIYVICKMGLANPEDAAKKIKVDAEIEDAIWMPLKEFQATTKHPMLQKVVELLVNDAKGLKETEMPSPIRGRNFKLYHP